MTKVRHDEYAKIVGRQINLGKTLQEARAYANALLKKKGKKK